MSWLKAMPQSCSRLQRTTPAVALVGHVQLDVPVGPLRRQPHLSTAVPERVVEEVPERLLEPDPVSAHPARRRG